jgi:chaperone modulatory protein CbpM
MKNEVLSLLSGDVLEENVELTLADLCRACRLPAEQVYELVEEGVVEPVGRDPGSWRFQGVSLHRVRIVLRLQRDLGVNLAGAALALDLLEELEQLRARMDRLGR